MERKPLEPHPPLMAYYAEASKRQPFVRRIFDDTAAWYDSIESVLSLRSGARYRRNALSRAGLQSGMRMLDLATGTGIVARAARAIIPGEDITALDPSIGMILAGREKQDLLVTLGAAEHLPFASGTFDFVAVGFALRHFADLRAVFGEVRRVLAPGGTLLILEITAPRSAAARAILGVYMNRIIPVVAALITRRRDAATLMRYYWDTVRSCVPPETILGALGEAGFTSVQRRVELGIFSEYTGTG
ncbi:MAG TPA: class I SAM-dependent methyltransferase [Thermoanaerobaculia bacterium]|nr:class I SAM-dependent methyltransferase [Thermoanaerobaculia bacterium]